jgi:site-specific DNA-methyltransferase (adenine-specific)
MTQSTVTQEDCMALMARYPDKYFDLAVVDPPFGLGEKLTNGGTWAAKYSKADSVWDKAPESNYFQQLFRVSKNQIIWGGNYFALPSTRCFLIWDKVAHMDTLADCEFAWTSFDRNAKIFKHVRNTSESRIHICQKPVKLYDWIFKNYAKEGDKILDTHLGSGSSRISAFKAGLDFTACELDPDYFAAQEKRFKEFTAQIRMF